MKNLFLMFIFASAINTFAQNNGISAGLQQPESNASPNNFIKNLNEVTEAPWNKPLLSSESVNLFKRSNELLPLNDSIYFWDYKVDDQEWRYYEKTTDMVYNSSCFLVSKIDHYFTDTWINKDRKIYTYDANHNLTSELIQLWHGFNHYFYDFERHSYTYDSQNNRLVTLWQISNTEGLEWGNTIQVINTYDYANNRSNSMHQTWNDTGWINDNFLTTLYDSNQNVISIVDQRWIEGDWRNTNRIEYTYDSDNHEISCLYQSWNSGFWDNLALYTSSYDVGHNLISYLTQFWESGSWTDWSRINSTYDVNNNRVSEITEKWNGNTWKNSRQSTYTYDGNNFLKTRSNKNLDLTGTTIQSGDSTCYYFHTGTAGISSQHDSPDYTVYPNPSNGIFRISSNEPIDALNVFDLPGKLVYSGNKFINPKSVSIDLSGYSKGIYLMKITVAGNSCTQKIVVN